MDQEGRAEDEVLYARAYAMSALSHGEEAWIWLERDSKAGESPGELGAGRQTFCRTLSNFCLARRTLTTLSMVPARTTTPTRLVGTLWDMVWRRGELSSLGNGEAVLVQSTWEIEARGIIQLLLHGRFVRWSLARNLVKKLRGSCEWYMGRWRRCG